MARHTDVVHVGDRKTLALRVLRQNSSAFAVAQALERHP
jgi:hypothetical protein